MKKIISLLNIKGGVGKTTTSNNLAVGLAKEGNQVLLIDLDPQANTTSMFVDDDIEGGVAACLLNPETVNQYILPTKYHNIDLLPSSLELALVGKNLLVSHQVNYNKLRKIINQLDKQYDYIVIDCSPYLDILTTNVLYVTDEVIVPIKIERFALDGYRKTVNEVTAIADDFERNIDISVLFTMVSRNNIQRDVIQEFKDSKAVKVYETSIRHQAKPATQASFNQEVMIELNSNVSQDYRDFIGEYLNKPHCEKEGDRK